MRFCLPCGSLFVVAGLLGSPTFGQVRLGPQGPSTPAPATSQGTPLASPRDVNRQPGGVRLGPHGPYTPAPRKSTTKGSPQTFVPPRDPNRPETFKITITPAPEPDLPLKYALLPKYENVKPGNSVPFYYRAVLNLKSRPRNAQKPFHDNYDRWLNGPMSATTRKEVREFLNGYGGMFAELNTAVHREKTEWSWRLKEVQGIDSIMFLLPEIQESRELGRLLSLKSRLQIADRKYDDAVETMMLGFKLGRDVAEPPTLINDLVGVAIVSIMTANVRDFIAAPGSPNLYWALARLPRPFIDMHPAMQYEMALPMKLFPAMKDAETADHSPEEWGRILGDAFQKMAQINDLSMRKGMRFESKLSVTGLALLGYPRAKRDLIAWGYDAKRVDAMPIGQVITIHQARTYRYMYQEMLKWSNLPYHQMLVGLRRSEDKLKREGYLAPAGQSREIIPLTALLLPAVTQAQKAGARLDGRLRGLQVLEAIRIYAAAHKGALPESLADIREVPIPVNPVTAQPYPYHFAAGKAVLEIPAPPGDPASIGWRFEISVQR